VVSFIVVLAFFTRINGLFPLATPVLYWISFGRPKFKTVVLDSVVLVGATGLIFAVLWQFDSPRIAISAFFEGQLMASVSGVRGSTGSRFMSFIFLIEAMRFPLILAALMILWARLSKVPLGLRGSLGEDRLRRMLFLFLVGCSASLPMLASKRVHILYFSPSIVFFSAAIAILLVSAIVASSEKFNTVWQRRAHIGLAIALVASLAVVTFNIGKPGSDALEIANANEIAAQVCSTRENCVDTISACPGVYWKDWDFQAYLQRYYKISVSSSMEGAPGDYVVANADCMDSLKGYVDTGAKLSRFHLMKRVANQSGS
jgi:hypothetical protein